MPTGDRDAAFEMMFRSTHDRLFAYVLRRTDPGEAEDVVAETFATAWRRFDAIPPDPLPWLYGVARKTLANARRSWRRRIQLASRLAVELGSSSDLGSDPAEQLEDAALMRAALRALRESDREALMLVAWEGLENQRASVVLGVSPEAFAVRLHRARRRLEAEVERLTDTLPPGERAPSEER